MILINKTISFAETIQTDGVEWLKDTYIPLMHACDLIQNVLLFKIDIQQEADDSFALQVFFEAKEQYELFCEKYQEDFDAILLLKFQNSIGVYKTMLTQI